MKVAIIYTLILSSLVGVISLMINSGGHPHNHLIGAWKETSWQYEKLDDLEGEDEMTMEIDHQMKSEISKSLVFHEAEVWHFAPDGEIGLFDQYGKSKRLDWRLKGRGNILKLLADGERTEYYNIKSLSADKMEIHFTTDIGARGVVKMVFEKVPSTISYAKKI
ncbi:hypothetical protein N6H18_17815 [Reichenbachiella agarivorans]|uniref:Lipocalin-like domain-containing protein n=1 Tax=Reichenbachiella agarivorans TaxID=2979464 RepID=A0ABY6CNT8_9BACT|nr:hypothetical protein [Reichenbachiella agarivorans]UXP32199.1 hypothetical protein N6H18_17815 [Reichenbachiella agarivorans]